MVLEEIFAQQALLRKKEIKMTMMSTIVAVALGLTPVSADGVVQPANADVESLIGRYSEIIDDTGTTHLRGINRNTGERFELTVNPFGRVEAAWATGPSLFKLHRSPDPDAACQA